MDNYNVVGDIAGNYLTLLALLDKMPKDVELISLGDPNDRGPRSKEVIEYLMSNGRTVNSNHAHMMVEAWKQGAMPGSYPHYYEPGLWPLFNGGMPTMASYAGTDVDSWGEKGTISQLIPKSHIKFLESCPMYIETDNYVLTHAPLDSRLTLEEASDLGGGFFETLDLTSDHTLIWNRYVSKGWHKHLGGKIQIFGHNSSDKVKVYNELYPQGIKVKDSDMLREINEVNKLYAICLDTSSAKVLTGLHLPTLTIYEQEYID